MYKILAPKGLTVLVPSLHPNATYKEAKGNLCILRLLHILSHLRSLSKCTGKNNTTNTNTNKCSQWLVPDLSSGTSTNKGRQLWKSRPIFFFFFAMVQETIRHARKGPAQTQNILCQRITWSPMVPEGFPLCCAEKVIILSTSPSGAVSLLLPVWVKIILTF